MLWTGLFASLIGFISLTAMAQTQSFANDPALLGEWSTGCWGNPGLNLSFRNIIRFDGKSYAMLAETFSEPKCVSQIFSTEERGLYESGAPLSTPPGAVELNQVLQANFITLTSESYVKTYNEKSICGYQDWTLNVAKNVTGKKCGGSVNPSAGAKFYDFYLTGKVDGETRLSTGYFDEDHDGSSPTHRPVEIGSTYGKIP